MDLNDQISVEKVLQLLCNNKEYYDVLVNCAGIAEADEFIHLSDKSLHTMFNVNFFAPTAFIKAFINELKTPQAEGILNIVSANGRISYPLLSGYAASNAALWSLGEALSVELNSQDLNVTTYVAPAMHSKMQKRLGRVALRYFKMDGNFPFDYPKRVAHEAWCAFKDKKDLLVSKDNRWRLWINALFPGVIKKRIRGVWKK